MKILKFFCFYLIVFNPIKKMKSQEIRNIITPNIVIGSTDKNSLNIEATVNLKTEPYFNISYLITKNIAVFGSYNLITWRNRRYSFTKGLLGGGKGFDYVENNNNGYSFGAAFINLFEYKKFNSAEILIGFENQKLNIIEFSPTWADNIDFINENYNTFFLQLNIIKKLNNESFRLGYSLKTSYYKLNSLENKRYDENKIKKVTLVKDNLFLVSFSPNIEYQLKKEKPYFLKFQVGISAALEEFEENVNREGFWGYNLSFSFISRL